jgi:hypothetical protein
VVSSLILRPVTTPRIRPGHKKKNLGVLWIPHIWSDPVEWSAAPRGPLSIEAKASFGTTY